jgi:hypothetical protein
MGNEPRIRCARCGYPAIGWAFIEGERYCHGFDHPSCYDQEMWLRGGAYEPEKEGEGDGDG